MAKYVTRAEYDALLERVIALEQTIKGVEANNRQLVTSNKQELVRVQKMTYDLVKVASKEISSNVYEKVVNHVMPQVENAIERLDYYSQDTDQLVTDYRRAAADQFMGGGKKKITDGKNDHSVISANVRMVFD